MLTNALRPLIRKQCGGSRMVRPPPIMTAHAATAQRHHRRAIVPNACRPSLFSVAVSVRLVDVVGSARRCVLHLEVYGFRALAATVGLGLERDPLTTVERG